jgi:hypothetical protein
MPYGLKNALATIVRATHITLTPHIGKTVEVYVDDIVVKSHQSDLFLQDLDGVFQSLRAHKMMLNPEKCVFGVAAGKLLGFPVSHRGIEANPKKIRAIENMRPTTNIKQVQRLTGCLAALSRFISKLGHRDLPFFKILRWANPIEWTEEAKAAFNDLKKYLTSPSVLVAPEQGEPLLLYITAADDVVSMVLVAERLELPPEGGSSDRGPLGDNLQAGESFGDQVPIPRGVQWPMYFVSKVLRVAPSRYPKVQKLLYAVLVASKKLHRYFQAHKISVTMTFPLGYILCNRHSTGRIAKWAAELEFEIEFVPRNMIKSQVLADFIAEGTPGRNHLDRLPMPEGAPPRGYPPSFTGKP